MLRLKTISSVLYMRGIVIGYLELSYFFEEKVAVQKPAFLRLWICVVRFSRENENTTFFLCSIHACEGYRLHETVISLLGKITVTVQKTIFMRLWIYFERFSWEKVSTNYDKTVVLCSIHTCDSYRLLGIVMYLGMKMLASQKPALMDLCCAFLNNLGKFRGA